jgi:hypothetical protein
MGSATNYFEPRILDMILGSGHGSGVGATVYVGLSTSAIGETGAVTEPSGGAYARVAVTNNDTNWPVAVGSASPNQKANGTAITFPTPTGSWGTVTDWFIADASTAGNVLLYGTLGTSRTVSSGDAAPSFAVGALIVTAD